MLTGRDESGIEKEDGESIITIKSDLDYRQKRKTILHELWHAHDFIMYPDENTKYIWTSVSE